MTVDPFFWASTAASRRASDPPAKLENLKTHSDQLSHRFIRGWNRETHSKTPAGPFQRMVLDFKTVSLKSLLDCSPQSRPCQSALIPSASVAVPRSVSLEKSLAVT